VSKSVNQSANSKQTETSLHQMPQMPEHTTIMYMVWVW